MEIHPLCAAYPDFSQEKFDELCSNIKKNGLQHEIVLYEDQILDGRHRYKACLKVGVKPSFVQWKGQCGDPVAFVKAENDTRRQLTQGEIAAISLQLDTIWKKMQQLREEGKKKQATAAPGVRGGKSQPRSPLSVPIKAIDTTKELAKKAGVGKTIMTKALTIQDVLPEFLPRIARGETSIDAVYPQAVKKRQEEKPKEARRSIIGKAHKRRMESALSLIQGACMSMDQLDVEALKQQCSQEEIKAWSSTVTELTAALNRLKTKLNRKD